MSRWSPVLALVALIAAGCVAPGTGVAPNTSLPVTLPHLGLTDAHDHADPAQHAAAWNVELLGWDPIAPDVTQRGSYNQLFVQGTRAFVGASALTAGGAPGVAIFNISGDDPVLVGTVETPDVNVIDAHGTDDGKYVVLAGHRENRVQRNVPAAVSTFCSGTPALNLCTPYVPHGVVLVDVADEAAPEIAATWASAPSGAHTAKVHRYPDGDYYVFIASYGFHYANRLASHVEILEVVETPLGTRLQPVAEFLASRPSGPDGPTNTFVHDMWIAEHPTAGLLMWVAYWDGGVVLVDVNDPSAPRELSAWRDFDAALYGNVHFARPVGVIGDRHVSLATPEFISAEHAGEAYVLDTTDPAAPKLLARWVLPGDPVNDDGYRFSPHNFDVRGTLVTYAHYHGGVWLLDLADPAAPVVKGYVFPTVPAGQPAYEHTDDAPNVWSSLWAPDGTMYAADISTGLYHYRVLSDEPGAPPYEAALAASG